MSIPTEALLPAGLEKAAWELLHQRDSTTPASSHPKMTNRTKSSARPQVFGTHGSILGSYDTLHFRHFAGSKPVPRRGESRILALVANFVGPCYCAQTARGAGGSLPVEWTVSEGGRNHGNF